LVLASPTLTQVVVSFIRSEFDGVVRGAFVGAVAEGLIFGKPTGAIVVLLAHFQLDSQ